MGHDKLRKFAENETFSCLLQPSASDILGEGGYFALTDQPVKGRWREKMFGGQGSGLVLELGCGKGEYTLGLARRNPSRNYVGVDIKGARLWRGAKTATAEGIRNAAFLRTRVEFLTALFAPSEVDEIWLTFSDPQFRSANSRLSSPLFLERYRKVLRRGGVVHLKTDSRFLHEYTKAVCAASGLKVLACTEDLYSTPGLEASLYEVRTFYETMFLGQGYRINYIAFVIDHDGPYAAPDFDEGSWRAAEGPRLLFGRDSAETRRQKMKV